MSVLVNGSPTNEFVMERGLQQGDPLALFLFTIVVEGLVGLIRQAKDLNPFQGFEVGRNKVEVSFLFGVALII